MRPFVLILSAGLVAACGTPEFRAERQMCEADWLRKIPPSFSQRLVTRYRSEERPTGVTTCTTQGNQTICRQETRWISIPYTAVETIDLNAPRRDPQIAACTARACTARFGNAECKPG